MRVRVRVRVRVRTWKRGSCARAEALAEDRPTKRRVARSSSWVEMGLGLRLGLGLRMGLGLGLGLGSRVAAPASRGPPSAAAAEAAGSFPRRGGREAGEVTA